MDYAKAKQVLCRFWAAYAVLMMGLSLVGLFMPYFNASLLVVLALGCVMLWAAINVPRSHAANITLQVIFGLVALECVAAFIGDVLSPLVCVGMLAVSGFSLFVWRKGIAPADET